MSTNCTPPSIEHMPQPGAFMGTPYKSEEGLFEYPFPTPPLPTPPYLPPSSSSPSSSSSSFQCIAGTSPRSDSPVNTKITSKLVKDGPIPPGLNSNRRGSVGAVLAGAGMAMTTSS